LTAARAAGESDGDIRRHQADARSGGAIMETLGENARTLGEKRRCQRPRSALRFAIADVPGAEQARLLAPGIDPPALLV